MEALYLSITWPPGSCHLKVRYNSLGGWGITDVRVNIIRFFNQTRIVRIEEYGDGYDVYGPILRDERDKQDTVDNLRDFLIGAGRNFGAPSATSVYCDLAT